MQLTHDRPEGYFFFRAIRDDAVVVLDRELRASAIVTPDQVIENWAPTSIEEIDAAALESVLALDPEVVVLGSGREQKFPDPAQLAPLMRAGIGVEVMSNAAAGRTYNLLAAEGRRVAAAILIGAPDSA